MLLIRCPHCGPRAGAEFTFERPEESIVPLDATPEAAAERLFTRDNPRGRSAAAGVASRGTIDSSGRSAELWRHAYGCCAWLRVERDTATHAIAATALWSPAP
jgi:sarcosine oxidase delta subunit